MPCLGQHLLSQRRRRACRARQRGSMTDWNGTERVLNRVKRVATLGNGASIDEEQASKDEKAIEAVFEFVLLGANWRQYRRNWSFVGGHLKLLKEKQALRARVRDDGSLMTTR